MDDDELQRLAARGLLAGAVAGELSAPVHRAYATPSAKASSANASAMPRPNQRRFELARVTASSGALAYAARFAAPAASVSCCSCARNPAFSVARRSS